MLSEIAEKAACEELFDRIRNVINPKEIIVPVASLKERLDASMSRHGQALKISARKKHPKEARITVHGSDSHISKSIRKASVSSTKHYSSRCSP